MRKRSPLQTGASSDQKLVERTRQRVARARRTRLLTWLVVLAVLAAVVYFGGHRLAVYMWGTP
jgi:hypothetical protein